MFTTACIWLRDQRGYTWKRKRGDRSDEELTYKQSKIHRLQKDK